MIVGLDWSMTSPGFSIEKDGHLYLHGISSKKKDCGRFEISDKITINVDRTIEFINNSDRFNRLSNHYISLIQDYGGTVVHLEGYSMGSGRGGMTFSIGECTGHLKAKLWELNIPIHIVSPTGLKKFATGKGNANKEAMMNQFCIEHGLDSLPNLSCMNDCIDAYWLMKYSGTFYEILSRNLLTSGH